MCSFGSRVPDADTSSCEDNAPSCTAAATDCLDYDQCDSNSDQSSCCAADPENDSAAAELEQVRSLRLVSQRRAVRSMPPVQAPSDNSSEDELLGAEWDHALAAVSNEDEVEAWNDMVIATQIFEPTGQCSAQLSLDAEAEQDFNAKLQMAHELASRMGRNDDGRQAFIESYLQSRQGSTGNAVEDVW